MRFVSRYGGFVVSIRPIITEAYAVGIQKTIQEPIYARFSVLTTRPEEVDLANEHWRSFNGFYQQEDEVTIVPPDYRIGAFDTELAAIEQSWSDETRHEVEQALIDYAERWNDIIVVPVAVLAPPWPRYDEYAGTPISLARKLVDEGYDLSEVMAYELVNQNRADVLAAIEDMVVDPQLEEVAG